MFVQFTFMLTVGLLSHGSEGVNSTCEGLPVIEGDSTNITCFFGEDVSKLQRDIKLYHDSYTVLTISWKDGLPDIHSKSGYQFEGRITSKLTVTIPRAQIENEGKYSCHVVLSMASDAKPCSLKVYDRCAVNLNTSSSEYNSTGCTKRSIHPIKKCSCNISSVIDISNQQILIITGEEKDTLREVKFYSVALMAGFFTTCVLLIISVCFNAYFIVQRAKSTRYKNQSERLDLEQNKGLLYIKRNTPNHPKDTSLSHMYLPNIDDNEEHESDVKDSPETLDVIKRCRSDSAYSSTRTSYTSNNKQRVQ